MEAETEATGKVIAGDATWAIEQGNVLDYLRSLPDACVHCVVTSPRVAFALQDDGWILRQDIIWAKPGPMPESVKNRCTKSHEYVFLLVKRMGYFWDGEPIKEKGLPVLPKPRKDGESWAETKEKGTGKQQAGCDGTANKRSVWTVSSEPFKEAHFATFPPKLIVPMIKAGTSERGCCRRCGAPHRRIIKSLGYSRSDTKKMRGNKKGDAVDNPHDQGVDINKLGGGHWNTTTIGWEKTCDCKTSMVIPCLVLDPFSGAGTTVMVARRLRRRGIGCDLNEKYVRMARRRVKMDSPLFN